MKQQGNAAQLNAAFLCYVGMYGPYGAAAAPFPSPYYAGFTFGPTQPYGKPYGGNPYKGGQGGGSSYAPGGYQSYATGQQGLSTAQGSQDAPYGQYSSKGGSYDVTAATFLSSSAQGGQSKTGKQGQGSKSAPGSQGYQSSKPPPPQQPQGQGQQPQQPQQQPQQQYASQQQQEYGLYKWGAQ